MTSLSFNIKMMKEEIIKESNELIVLNSSDGKEIYFIDPKTMGIKETFMVYIIHLNIYLIKDDSCISENTLVVSEKYGHMIGFQNEKYILNYWNLGNPKPFIKSSLNEKLSYCTLTHNELYFISGSYNGNIFIWDTLSGSLLKKFKASHKGITKILISFDDGILITGSSDGKICSWLFSEIFSGKAQWKLEIENIALNEKKYEEIKAFKTFIGHTNNISDLKISRNNFGSLFSSSYDKTIIHWDLLQGIRINTFVLDSPINCIETDLSEDIIYAGCKNHIIYRIKINKNSNFYNVIINKNEKENENYSIEKNNKDQFLGHVDEILAINLYKEENLLISAGKNGQMIFWNDSGIIIKKITLFKSAISNLLVINRPLELDLKKSLIQTKKQIAFKSFKKIEGNDSEKQEECQPTLPINIKQIKKTSKNNKKKLSLNLKKIIHMTKTTLLHKDEANSKVIAQKQINDIKEENQKLLELNNKLFKYIISCDSNNNY